MKLLSIMMKSRFIPLFLIVLMNAFFLLSLLWFPVTRDEFYYLDKSQLLYVFSEYWDSYNYVNPRLGQFFLNVVARSQLLKLIFGFFVFNGFIMGLFANIFRRFPQLKQKEDAWKYLVITSAFILLINYFGELFYYSPFLTNYTFTHVLYLLYIYVMTEYFIFDKKVLPKSIFKITGCYLVCFCIGMGNEHVPPVLLLFSGICGLFYIFKRRRLPSLVIIVANIMVFIGYLCLFFAPANTIKYKTVGRERYGFSIYDYGSTFLQVIKSYYYYNLLLLVIGLLAGAAFLFLIKRKLFKKKCIYLITSYGFMAIIAILVISYSPLIGTRLIFFSTILFFIIISIVFVKLDKVFKIHLLTIKIVSTVSLFIYFSISIIICFNANIVFNSLVTQVLKKRAISDDVLLDEKLDYFNRYFQSFNRRVLLENGSEYVDEDKNNNTSQEVNLIKFFKLKTLSHK